MSSQSSGRSQGPLAGVRVLDMATMLAGPYGATLMGDLGADVIKVESHWGDDSRHLGPERDGERSPYLSLNRSKRAIVLELKHAAGREVFGRLAATADVLITNIREPALSKLGLDYEHVREHRPDIIWIGVTAFGADGPYAGRPGIDFLAQGFGGLLALNGEPDGDPVRVTVPLIDVMTSLLVSTAALTALRTREQTGEGQRIDISLLDALLHAQASALGTYLIAGEPTPRTGNRSLYFAPSGIYTCGDGRKAVVTCPSEKFFRNLCTALDVDWADDSRFESIDRRLANEGGWSLRTYSVRRSTGLPRSRRIRRSGTTG
jgi:crotonobetainyl-CoA:carnitine CoA-transferase CaiB-like acyl-CoA transferase